jgi:hypothetical protein
MPERPSFLRRRTIEESRAIFDELVKSGDGMPISEEDALRLLRWRVETKIAVRRVFRRLAQAKGYI